MQMLLDLLATVLPLLYGLAAANYAVYFARRDPFAERTCTPFLAGAVLLDLVFLLTRAAAFERFPIASLPEALSVIAFAVAGVYLYVERIQQNKATGVFIVTMAALLQIVASTLLPHHAAASSELLADPFFGLHTMTAVLSYSAFAVGAVYCLMFLLLYRAIKRKSFGLLFNRLPSLDGLESMGYGATLLGWLFLTATIVVGIIMSLQHFPNFYRDPQFIASLVVWAIYGSAVAAYYGLRWRGAKAAGVALAGFCIAIAAMVGIRLLPSFHASFA